MISDLRSQIRKVGGALLFQHLRSEIILASEIWDLRSEI